MNSKWGIHWQQLIINFPFGFGASSSSCSPFISAAWVLTKNTDHKEHAQ